MAVSEVREIYDRDGSDDARSSREYKRNFWVTVTSDSDDAYTVLRATGIPRIYDAHPSDTGTVCNRRNAKEAGYRQWEVECSYSTDSPDSSQHTENPLDRAAEVEWDFQPYQRPVSTDIYGQAIVNSAKEPFDPPIEIDDSRPSLRITRYEATWDALLALTYQDAVNSDTFLFANPGQAKIRKIAARRHHENNTYCWQVTYEIDFRREGWTIKPLDQGFSYFDANGNRVVARDVEGSATPAPILLNGSGGRLSDGAALLDAAVNAQDTQLFVNDDHTLPATFPYTIRIGAEVMTVTDEPDTGVLLVTRAQRDTVAAAHAENAEVTLDPHFLSFTVYKLLPFKKLKLP